jgi:hypothetical protein
MKSTFTLLLLSLVWHSLLHTCTAQEPAPMPTKRLNWKLEDFQPLTELPWDDAESKPLTEVLTVIFREPDPQIRYPVLATYLRQIPVGRFGDAFDQCIIMEGRQTPDGFMEFLLRIWAERDPVTCWERTQGLFQVIGIEYGWLNYDSWKRRDRITVRDAKAIQASPIWMENEGDLLGFPFGVQASSRPKEEKVKMLRAFADAWFSAFHSWPGYELNDAYEPQSDYGSYYHHTAVELLKAFAARPESVRERNPDGRGPDYRASVEVGLRRWLKSEPQAALEILKKRNELIAPVHDEWGNLQPSGPSTEWLMIWRQVDLAAMTQWVESLGAGKSVRERSMLMSWVDEPTRTRWLKEAKKDSESTFELLIGSWASWNPQPAMEAALATRQREIVLHAVNDAVYGPFSSVWNTCHPGIGFIRDFDMYARIKSFIGDLRDSDWGTAIMEQWGDIDVGEAARYGLDFMLESGYAPREELIKLFSGDDEFSSDADMVDRTFCCLRVWAVTKPEEMRAWLANMKDEEMRTALTWLLENPWGTGENAERQ